jgi:hypothetical protein
MNPVLQDVLAFVSDRRQFTRFVPEKLGQTRWAVEYNFKEGGKERREYDCDPATFLSWWKEAEDYLRSTAEAIQAAVANI